MPEPAPPDAAPVARSRTAGAAMLAIWLFHAWEHTRHGTLWELFWACNMSVLFTGFAAVAGWQRGIGMGVCMLAFGAPLWIIDLISTGDFYFGSLLTHFGVPLLGVWSLRPTGWPAGTTLPATAVLIGFMLLSRLVTPPEMNINLVFRIYPGWEHLFPNHAAYLGFLAGIGTGLFWLTGAALGRLLKRPDAA